MPILSPRSPGPSLVVCSTCRFDAEAREDAEGVTGGARMLQALRAAAAGDPALADLSIEPMACLFACSAHCVAHLRAPGKIGYVLGSFQPTETAARAILDYVRHYLNSAEGQVPYRCWPEGVKGHFIVRTPPEGWAANG